MFDKSPTWKRFSPPPSRVVRVHLGHVPYQQDRRDEERSSLRVAVVIAVLFHLVLLLIQLPDIMREPQWSATEKPVYAVQQIRFRPPPPAAQQRIPKVEEKRRKIPIPDPTPDDPEPIRTEEIEVPDPELQIADLELGLGIPEAPTTGVAGTGAGPMQVGGDVAPPIKVFAPSPPYTEEARQGRIQGVVILEAIIDAMGNVSQVKVLKGLPMGLSETAVEAASNWRFEPATKNGIPVPVFFNLTIRFSLQ